MKKSIVKLIVFISLFTLSVLCLSSCEDLLANGFHTHEYGEWGIDTATCTQGGSQTRVCKICEAKDTRNTAALGHSLQSYQDKAATCVAEGYSSYKACSRCDYTEGTLLEATGHSMGAWSGNTASCISAGKETSKCKNCTYKEERVTEQTGHTLDNSGNCSVCGEKNVLVLIENGKANFKVVYTMFSGSYGKLAADNFIKKLRALGIEVDDAISDGNINLVSDCEIIIGANARNRGDECNVKNTYLGQDGETIKFVNKRIVIAAGTDSETRVLFDSFVENKLGITSSTTELKYLQTKTTYFLENLTDYVVDSIKIANVDLSKFTYVYDVPLWLEYNRDDLINFHDSLYNVSGYWLDTASASEMTETGRYFIVRYVEDAGENGFRAYYDGNNFIVECAYKNKFNTAFASFANETFLYKDGNISLASSFKYTVEVSVEYYESFGAKGDGVTCDFQAIYDTHIAANKGGQTVKGKAGATYYISPESFTKTIPIETDVDFCGATFIVDDRGSDAYKYRQLALFTFSYGTKMKTIYANSIATTLGKEYKEGINPTGGPISYVELGEYSINKSTTSIPWLAEYLDGTSLVRLYNGMHYDFRRHGSNISAGRARTDIFIVDAGGNFAEDSIVAFDFDIIHKIEIRKVEDKPITVKNGDFVNICCRTVPDAYTVSNGETTYHPYINKFHEYMRGFKITRANVTLQNIDHRMDAEPQLGWAPAESGYDPNNDSVLEKYDPQKNTYYGSRRESYPYYGFYYIDHSYNLNIKDSVITGHTTYYEDKAANITTGGAVPAPVAMGSYDFVVEYSTNIVFDNVTQPSEDQLRNLKYWGVMSSNGSKNMTFKNCKINRFDAHRGFWNATLEDTTIGHSIQLVGGGYFIADNVKKLTKSNFLTLRSDYGATFDGDVILKDCIYEGYTPYNTDNKANLGTGVNSTQNQMTVTRYTSMSILACSYNTSNSGWQNGADDATNLEGAYWLRDFGYTCYMPRNVVIDNFTSKVNGTYLFNNLPDKIFTKTYVEGQTLTKDTVRYPYQLTESITYKNMNKAIPVCSGRSDTYTKLYSIPITKVNIG